ncbi:gluconokinase [Sediminicoccus sp. BL-A-41-H5]|uniref:gluconokinase n=1 Tax=Sediminicoccus sp. BL-A-41-H5 TaxID=3421106 RepID=UPI003D66D1FA
MTLHLLVMGVSGSGKSTIGAQLALALSLPFGDADAFHPPANVRKMSAGTPLTDEDRWPWLDALGAWLAAQTGGGVIACSALKRAYRDRLRGAVPGLRILHLAGQPALITARQAAREGHFMPPSLMASQFATLEPPAPDEAALVLDITAPPEVLLLQAAAQLRRIAAC